MSYSDEEGEVFLGRSVTQTKTMSDDTANDIDSEVRLLVDKSYATATKMAMKKEDTNLSEKVKKRKVNQKKLAGNDKFEADPTLTSQIMRPDNPSNDNDNKI